MLDEDIASRSPRRADAEPAQRILTAARREVAEHGIDGAHMRAISRQAGIALGLIRYYFGSKDGLLAEVMEAEARQRLAVLREQLDAPDSSAETLLVGVAVVLADCLGGERGANLVWQEMSALALRDDAVRVRLAQLHAEYRDEFAAILRRHEQRGVITLSESAAGTAAALVALGQGLGAEAQADPGWDPRPALGSAVRVAHHLMGR